jgi:hypothetical protein
MHTVGEGLAETPPHLPRKRAATSPRKRSEVRISVIARSKATKQSSFLVAANLDCFASFAMTWRHAPHSHGSIFA